MAHWLVDLSTWRARRTLNRDNQLGILVDNTVLSHATTHETAWISTERAGSGSQTIDSGYAARIAVHPANSNDRDYHHIRQLPGLISLYRQGLIQLHTSAELQAEQFRKPAGLFRGYGYCDHNLFSSVKLESIDGYVFPDLGPKWMNLPNAGDQQRRRLEARAASDPEYASLVDVLGPSNSQDAWHIRTAEQNGLFCFLTMDYQLLKNLEAQKGAKRIKALQTRVMAPSELGQHIGLFPIPPHILSYAEASFPVRSDLAWPDGKRKGRKRR
ncbi:hypothetical protein EUV02_05435 [Polymorphobacter arshaanensis]|uniref:Uncharacterized protein n=1 Tax=Glacieibacterium arshaanense TaxID=2511025 RepID=A0A4Y9ES07_9SPHN|nr:hypothetical protein [Polymorphobacter arshaanensis]TFU06431.1 hypothetical protein EUV02_05435 [Polymorphobacter arshaanensis]